MTCQLSRAAWQVSRDICDGALQSGSLCYWHAPGDERHFMLECPQFDDIRAQYPDLLQDALDSMRNQVRTAQASPTGTISGPGLDRPFEFARVIP